MRLFKAAAIFLFTLIAIASFAPGDIANPGQVTRFALALSMSDGHLDIDEFSELTVDIARFEGHYYADKPPGLSMLAVPAVTLTRAILGIAPDTWPLADQQATILVRAAVLSTVGLLAALAAAVLYLLARRCGASDRAALFASCGLALATPFFAWSTTIFVHAATGSLLLLAVASIMWSRGRRLWWIAPALGLLLGYTLTVDLTAAPAVAVLGLFYLLGERDSLRGRLIGAMLGGLAGLMPLFIYNWLAFHSPFKLGYSEVVGFAGMKVGLFGLTWPDPLVAWEILFGLHRGLLPLAPVLLLVPFGWWAMWRRPELRGLVVASIGVALSFVLVNSSYFYWDGGWSTGPRHLVGMLPLVAIALAFAWPQRAPAQFGALALLVVSLFFSAATAAVEVFADVSKPFPLWDPVLIGVFAGMGTEGLIRMLIPWLGFAMLAVLRERPAAVLK